MALDLSRRHDWWHARLPRSPRDEGTVELVVVRPPGEPGRRETPQRVEVRQDGLAGDKWSADPEAPDGSQVSLMNVHVARSVAGEHPHRIGDNLLVDLELSEENLPVGTRLEVGDVQLVVSEVPHRPCRSFHDRFGATAAKRVARANRRGRRGRGVLCRVAREGTIRRGDRIRKCSTES